MTPQSRSVGDHLAAPDRSAGTRPSPRPAAGGGPRRSRAAARTTTTSASSSACVVEDRARPRRTPRRRSARARPAPGSTSDVVPEGGQLADQLGHHRDARLALAGLLGHSDLHPWQPRPDRRHDRTGRRTSRSTPYGGGVSATPPPLPDEDFRRFMLEHRFGMDEIVTKLNILRDEFTHLHDYNPIETVSSRLKSPESLVEKMQPQGHRSTSHVLRRGPRSGSPTSPASGWCAASPPTSTGSSTCSPSSTTSSIVEVRDYIKRAQAQRLPQPARPGGGAGLPVRRARCRSSWRCSSARSRWTSGPASSTRSTTSTAATCRLSCSTGCTRRPRRRTRSTRRWSGCTRRSAASTGCRPRSCRSSRAATARTPPCSSALRRIGAHRGARLADLGAEQGADPVGHRHREEATGDVAQDGPAGRP